MAAIAGLPPETLKRVLEENNWEIIDETQNIWLLAEKSNPRSVPISIPKHGDVVDPEVMDYVAHHSRGLTDAVLDAVRRYVATQP